MDKWLLTLMTFVPVAAIPLLWVTNVRSVQRMITAAASAISGVLSLMLFFSFQPGQEGALGKTRYAVEAAWISAGNLQINYAMDVDGFSVLLVSLTGILGFLSMFAADSIQKNIRGFYAMYLLLLTGMFGTFVATDLFLFYVFWEIMLLPMFFLVGIWGGPRREFAAIKFFLYTLVGSVLMLGAFLAIYFQLGTMSIPEIWERSGDIFAGDNVIRMTLFTALFIGFAVKVPVFPFHTWLPLAHVEAPTPISVILAGVLLKMGGYGLIRMAYPWFPDAAVAAWPVLATLAVVSIVYGAFVAMAQTDFKKMVAYSSVSHMGYVLLGLSSLTAIGVNGAVLQMFNHGTISAMMFLLVGFIYDQAHHRDMNRFGGFAKTLPKYTFIGMIGFFAALGLPGMSGFISEMMVFFGAFKSELPGAKMFTIVGTLGIVMGAVYILVMIQKVFLGVEREKPEHEYHDFKWMSVHGLTLIPLAAITIFLGVYPKPAIDMIDPAITNWLKAFEEPIAEMKAKRADKIDTGKIDTGKIDTGRIDSGMLPPSYDEVLREGERNLETTESREQEK